MGPPEIPKSGHEKDSGGGRRLTQLLTALGQDVILQSDGRSVTRDEALAELIWAAALGQIQIGQDDFGPMYAKPDKSMALAILERREGKTVPGSPDESRRLTAADRVSEIAKADINRDADALDSVPGYSEDVDVSDDGDQDT